MSAATTARAPSGVSWNEIDWITVQRQVRRLQARIVKATQVGRHNKAKALQWLLTHSFSGKALAVKRVSENKGKTPPRCRQDRLEHTEGKKQCHRIVTAARILALAS